MDYLLNRIREPSTWAGIASLAISLGLGVPPGTIEAAGQAAAGIAGLLAIFVRERGK